MRKKVLIVSHGDFMEVFADDDVDVRIAHMPKMETPEGELLAEKYLTRSLPLNYRHLYCHGKVRTTDNISTVRPSDLAKRQWALEMLVSLSKAQELLSTPF